MTMSFNYYSHIRYFIIPIAVSIRISALIIIKFDRLKIICYRRRKSGGGIINIGGRDE